jgi:hypothetical protein
VRDLNGAARVYLTLDELAEMLGLPEGHRLEAAEELPDGYRLGLALTIVSYASPILPKTNPAEPVMQMDLPTYRGWGTRRPAADYRPVRTVLREVEEPAERMVPRRQSDDHQNEPQHYTPVKPLADPTPVVAGAQGGDIQLVVPPPEDKRQWPTFPGEQLPYTSDPGDEDIHTGGPR